ncbi:MAG: molybdopterin cofactor-binding domain-containing protein [Thalassobaculum sp.]
MIVEGQIHGGLAQGIGQALLEGCVYDEDGQLSDRLLHGLQHAAGRRCAGSYVLGTEITLCTHNSLGVKGCGEVGAIGSPPAVINAVVDALWRARRHRYADAGHPAKGLDAPFRPRTGCGRSARRDKGANDPCTTLPITSRRPSRTRSPPLRRR